MVRRLILGVAIGLLAAVVATPAQAAEWCFHDPALVFAAPHDKHKMTIYATEGVQGSDHSYALVKTHVDLHVKPGKGRGTIALDVHGNIHGRDHDSFSTVLIVSSEPDGGGTLYAIVMGRNDRDMHAVFDFVYGEGG